MDSTGPLPLSSMQYGSTASFSVLSLPRAQYTQSQLWARAWLGQRIDNPNATAVKRVLEASKAVVPGRGLQDWDQMGMRGES
jgi:hypothetical protein